jgi:hypothetical protein
MSEYGEITLGNGEFVVPEGWTPMLNERNEPVGAYFDDEPVTLSIEGLKPYAWTHSSGSGLLNGAVWGKCPDCEGDCVWFEGRAMPTHRGPAPE